MDNMAALDASYEQSTKQVITSGKRIQVRSEYDDNHELWIDFTKSGVNNIFGIGNMYLVPNRRFLPNRLRPIFKRTTTDWVGPYRVSADADGNENELAFTSGYHGYNGNQTGSPTARTVNHNILADGTITVTNRIQGYNTKVKSGQGREILEEKVKYTLQDTSIQVEVVITALEDVTFDRYYGLQSVLAPHKERFTL